MRAPVVGETTGARGLGDPMRIGKCEHLRAPGWFGFDNEFAHIAEPARGNAFRENADL